jgi:cytoskeleton protein RodZ
MTAQSAPVHPEHNDVNEENVADDSGAALRAHERLRAAREQRGLSRDEVAETTKIPQRSLEALEEGEYDALPSRTYAIGFSRTFARAVGLDGEEIAEQVRVELDGAAAYDRLGQPDKFEPGDPARVASPRIAWIAAIAGLVLMVAGALTFWRSYFAPGAEFPPLQDDDPAAQGEATQQAAAAEEGEGPDGPISQDDEVVFTSLADEVWVKFYDGNGRQLMQKIMGKGESYTVPGDVERPLLWTGRPEALGISVGGRELPRLSAEQVTMKDVPVSAIALGQRFGQPVEGTPAPAPASTAED